jgi:hypothetical protein
MSAKRFDSCRGCRNNGRWLERRVQQREQPPHALCRCIECPETQTVEPAESSRDCRSMAGYEILSERVLCDRLSFHMPILPAAVHFTPVAGCAALGQLAVSAASEKRASLASFNSRPRSSILASRNPPAIPCVSSRNFSEGCKVFALGRGASKVCWPLLG